MTAFRRTGELKDITSYPQWLQDVVAQTSVTKMRLVNHEFFLLMRDAKLPLPAMRRFLIGVWPTIEQFPRFMAATLKKAAYGEGHGVDKARKYLMQNIRVEAKHADHWVEWAKAAGVTLDDLKSGANVEELEALAHWCWTVTDNASLHVAIAATNFAVEGATGEWSCVVCSKNDYFESIPKDFRGPASRWLRVHAEYDDTHPWEALDIIATLLGHEPSKADIEAVRSAIQRSYFYMGMAVDSALAAGSLEHGDASNDSQLGILAA